MTSDKTCYNTHSMRIAIQGVAGSFHDEAAHRWFGDKVTLVPAETFAAVFDCLKDGRADYAVVAIKNSTAGEIEESIQLLNAHSFPVIGEIMLPIAQQLIGLPGAGLADITAVYSHPVALPQCSVFLASKLPHAKQIEYFDTAASVDFVKQQNDPHLAAIASQRAAELYGLPVLSANIENDKANVTSFVVLSAL